MFEPDPEPKNEEKDNDPNINRERHLNELNRDHKIEEAHDEKEELKKECCW